MQSTAQQSRAEQRTAVRTKQSGVEAAVTLVRLEAAVTLVRLEAVRIARAREEEKVRACLPGGGEKGRERQTDRHC